MPFAMFLIPISFSMYNYEDDMKTGTEEIKQYI
jgi:hypothetical protein